ncbi:MAG TPA: cellulase family glycosylhydrolase, partial [Longimicrobium sp.]
MVAGNPPATCLPWLRRSGRQIVRADTAQPVLLRGANIMEAEWKNNITWEKAAIPRLASWKGNVVIHGFASDPVNRHRTHYLALLDRYVALTRASHVYLVLSWRSNAQNGAQPSYPGRGARSALAALAARYRGDSHVMFSLHVEPHHVTWSFVRPIFERMVDAIRHAATPYIPMIFIPGVGHGKDVSGAITDPVKRSNIVYKS